MTVVLRRALCLITCGRGKKERYFFSASALLGLFEMSSISVIEWEKAQYHSISLWSSGRNLYDNIHAFCFLTPFASLFQCSFVSVPDILFIFLLNMMARLCLKMREKKNLHSSLVKSVARKTIQHHFQNTKSISRRSEISSKGWAQSETGYKKDKMNSHTSCYLDELRLSIDNLVSSLSK